MDGKPESPGGSRPLVAILDDDAGFRAAAGILLADDFDLAAFGAEEELFRFLSDQEPDVLLLDLHLGDGVPDGFSVLERLRAEGRRFPVIVLTILAGLQVTARAVELGVPFLQKDRELDADRFRQQIRLVLHASRLSDEIGYHRRMHAAERGDGEFPWPREGWGAELLRRIQPFLTSSEPILLEGERGTGKKTLARWIHDNSPRAEGPFLVVSPLGLDETAIARELFGTATAGRKAIPGALAASAGGTLFLEDLHLLPDAVHQRLIHAIEERAAARNGTSARHRVTSRIIAARAAAAANGKPAAGRTDLFWNAYRIHLAPLRERRGDLPFHLDRMQRDLAASGMPAQPLRAEDLDGLNLPGNFYDLRAALVRGIDAVRDPAGEARALDSGIWKRLAAMPLRRAYAEVLVRYLREVERLYGRDVEKWRAHIGYERATVYRFFKVLDDEG